MGCARNEVDSEELAARLESQGWTLVKDAEHAEAVMVNTCGFVDIAKADSINTIIEAADLKESGGVTKAVVAVGCLAQRYGSELASDLPEADAVLSFDDYPKIGERLDAVMRGEKITAHTPSDRRALLPISPVDRAANTTPIPGHGSQDVMPSADEALAWQPPILRRRLENSPVAPVKLASGCDRRCTFCAIPSFRGSFISRPPADVVAEVAWLAGLGVTEAVLVSENSTSYGKDLGNLRLLESLLPAIGQGTDIARIRVAYLQPAEVRPDLLTVMANTPVVAPYFDLSFQHASATLLRRMKRFGGKDSFLELIATIRDLSPAAGIRSNVIVGFPGESDEEFAELIAFLEQARLDAVGVFSYSDEEGTEAFNLEPKVDQGVIDARVRRITDLVDELMAQRAQDRIGELVQVVIESFDEESSCYVGHAGHQGPDDGDTQITGATATKALEIGQLVSVRVIDSNGVDLVAELAN
ncbi:MAG: radical SAM protein [Actinomycetales bacterium]|nr:radical SAM protein [Actinomycetales bacterium]